MSSKERAEPQWVTPAHQTDSPPETGALGIGLAVALLQQKHFVGEHGRQ